MSVGSQDLAGALLSIGGFVLALALVAALAVWIARRRGSTTIVLDAALAVSQVWVLLAALSIVFVVWRWITESETFITQMPVTVDWPETLPFEPTGSGTELLSANLPTADVTIFALGAAPRILLALADALSIVLFTTPAVMLLVICRHALRGKPFARLISTWMFISAVVVLLAGTMIDIVANIGRTLAAAEVLPGIESGAAVSTQGLYQLTVPLWPLGAALALAALGVVFRHGAVLQRDTEGLV